MNRRTLLAAALAGVSAPTLAFGARRDDPDAKRRLCVLGPSGWEPEHGPVLRKWLAPFGFSERNLAIEYCSADAAVDASMDQCAAKLVRSGCDALFTQTTNYTRALQRATSTIPIVTAVGDPVGSGFAATLARPGGNITGLSYATVEAMAKLLEFARLLLGPFPAITILGKPGDDLVHEVRKRTEAAERARGLVVRHLPEDSPAAVEREFKAMNKRGERVALAHYSYSLGNNQFQQAIAEAALRNRIALVTIWDEWVRAGALLSYATFFRDQGARHAAHIALVLRGATPGDIPFELPDAIRLAVNRATASRLGITVPAEILISATEVID